MPENIAPLSGPGPQQIWIKVTRTGQDWAANRTDYYGEVRYYGNGYGSWSNSDWSWSADFGTGGFGGTFRIPQSQSTWQYHTLWSGNFSRFHDGNGNLGSFTVSASITTDHYSVGSGGVSTVEEAAPRIPQTPNPPTNMTVVDRDATSFGVRYGGGSDNGSAIIEHQIQWSRNSTFTDIIWDNYTVSAYSNISQSNPRVTLANHTSYWVRGRSRNVRGWGVWSIGVPGSTLGNPTAPNNLVVTPSSTVPGQNSLSWSAPTTTGEGGIVGYVVFRNGTQIASYSGTNRTYVDAGRTPYQSYTYQVAARNAYSVNYPSSGGRGPLSTGTTVVAQGAPSAPRNLIGESDPSLPGVVNLSWNSPINAGPGGITGYKIYNSPGVLLAETNNTNTSFSVQGLTPGNSYTLYVSAKNSLTDASGGDGDYSDRVTVTPIGEPQSPTGFTAITSPSVANRITLSWTAPGGVLSGYSIFQRINGSFTLIARIGSQHTTFSVDGQPDGVAQTFHVRARTVYTDTLEPGYPGNWGGPATPNATATASLNTNQSVPNVSATTSSTNLIFSGVYTINAVTNNTIGYAKVASDIAQVASGGSVANTTNAVFNGTYVISTYLTDPTKLTFTKTASNVSRLGTSGSATNLTNQTFNGTFTAISTNTGANLVTYANPGTNISTVGVPGSPATSQKSTITNESNQTFNGTGKVLTSVTDTSLTYAQTGSDIAVSNAAGVVIDATNRDIFNGTYSISSVERYNFLEYQKLASDIPLRVWNEPNGVVYRSVSTAELDIKFRSGWSG